METLGLLSLFLLLSVIISEIDPITGGLAFAGAFSLGVLRRSLWTALILAVGGAALNLDLLHSRWISVSVLDSESRSAASHLGVLFGTMCGSGMAPGALRRSMGRRPLLDHGRPLNQLIDGRDAPAIHLCCVMERNPNVEGKGHA
jgi:hypothetical protein